MGLIQLPNEFSPGIISPRARPVGNRWRVNWKSPSAKGLTRAFLFNSHTVTDLITGRTFQAPIGETSGADQFNEFVRMSTAAGGGFDLGTDVLHSGKLSIIAGINPSSLTGSQTICSGDSDIPFNRSWQFRLSGNKVQLISFISNANSSVTSTISLSLNKYTIVGCTHNNNASSNNLRVFMDGINDGSTTFAGNLDQDPATVGIGARFADASTPVEFLNGNLHFLYLWGERYLEDVEHREIADNPSSILESLDTPVYFTSSVAPAVFNFPLIEPQRIVRHSGRFH